jgi:hypothetical protein
MELLICRNIKPLKIASQISFLEVKGYDNGKGEAALVLKDPKTNALKQMVNFAKQFTGL